jgi:hypothetical protein
MSARKWFWIAAAFGLAVWMSTCMRPAYTQAPAPGTYSSNVMVAGAATQP